MHKGPSGPLLHFYRKRSEPTAWLALGIRSEARCSARTGPQGNPILKSASTTDSQQNIANSSAMDFLQGNLSKLLKNAVEQLSVPKYQNYQRILFLGFQPDSFYLAPWTESAIDEIKHLFSLKAQDEYGIKVVFSDDIGFSVARYL
jgi:hypothetical protein